MSIVLLPGLDGTGELFDPLIKAAPAQFNPIAVELPHVATYRDLLDAVRPKLPTGQFAVLGESFSGPLAMAVARELPDRVVAVILCNSFVSPPLARVLRCLPWSAFFRLPPPRWVVRWFFVGRDAPPDLVGAVRAAIAKTPRRVLAARMHAVFTLPKTTTGMPVTAPILCLTGTHDALDRLNLQSVQRVASRVVHKTVPGPHLLLQAAPADAWSEISAFLASEGHS